MQNKKLTIKESVLWNTWGSVIYLGAQWLQTVLVTRMLGYEEGGIFSLAMSVTNIFYAISVYGMKDFQISDAEGKYSPGNYVASRIVTGVGALLLCIGFTIINRYDFYQSACIIVYMLFKLSEAFFDVFLAFYQKHWRMDLMGKSLTIRAVLMLSTFVATMWWAKNLLLAILLAAAAVYCVIIFYDMQNARRLEMIRCHVGVERVKLLLLECLPLAVFSILSTSIGSIPRYFLELYQGSEKLGIYAAIATPTLIVQMAATYIFNPMVTVFSESFYEKDKTKFVKTLRSCLMASAIVGVVAVVGGKVFGRFGLRLLYGESILEYEYLLLPLIVCTITTAIHWLLCGVLTVLRNFRSLLIGSGCAAVLSAVFSIWMIPRWDMQGATYALMWGNFIGVLIFVMYMIKDIKIKFAVS